MKNKVLLSLVYFFWYAAVCVITAFLPLYLQTTFSKEQVGSLFSGYYASGMIIPVLGTWLIQKISIKRLILCSFIVLSVLFFAINLNLHYQTYWLIFCFCGLLANLAIPQIYYVTSELSSDGNFSKIRLWGSIGFILASLIFGYFLKEYLHLIPNILGILTILTMFFFILVDSHNLNRNTGIAQYKITTKEINFLLSSIMTMAGLGIFLTFFSLDLDYNQYSQFEIGLIWALSTIFEVIAFHFMPITYKKINLNYILLWSYLASIIRFILTALFIKDKEIIFAVQILNAFGYGWMHAGSIETIKKFINPNFGQSLYFMLANGLGFWIGISAGNYLLAKSGFSMVFMLAAFLNFLAILFLLPNLGASNASKALFPKN